MHLKIAGLVVVAAAVAACSTGSGTTEDPEPAVEQRDPETIYRLDPESGSVLGEMPILRGSVWVRGTAGSRSAATSGC